MGHRAAAKAGVSPLRPAIASRDFGWDDVVVAAHSSPRAAMNGAQRMGVRTAMMIPEQVLITPAAEGLIVKLRAMHGPLMFHQSGGCCDGSSPMCFAQGEFLLGDSDHQLGTVAECPFYMSKSQFEYWKHTQLILDVVPGRGGMFSLENPEGVRFLIRSRVFTNEEIAALRGAGRI